MFWTSVDGKLLTGEPLSVYLAGHEGQLYAVRLHAGRNPAADEEFLNSLGSPEFLEERGNSTGSGLMDAAVMQVEDYFAGRQLTFDLPLHLRGTPFQVNVWRALTRIPFGETRSYGDIARELQRPGAVRAIGQANGRNCFPLVIPCHRVIASGGKLGGFTGGIALKKALLRHEAEVLARRGQRFF